MKSTPNRPQPIGLWVVLFASIVALAPTLYPGYWQSLEGFLPVFNITQLDALADMAVRPDLWRGTGGASFLLAQPFLLLGMAPVAAVRVSFALCFLLGGLSTFVWLRARLGDRSAGLAGVLYALWPPFLATVYVRGSLSDAWVLALLPLSLAGISTYAATRSRSAGVVVALGIIWMWRSQAGLALCATILLLAYVLIAERDGSSALVVALSGAAGLASLIPLWAITAPAPVVFADHFVYIFQLLDPQWTTAPSVPGWQDSYPFQLGIASLAFSLVALWLWIGQPRKSTQSAPGPVQFWRRNVVDESTIHQNGTRPSDASVRRKSVEGPFCLIAGVLLILLSLSISAPIWRWSGADRLLTYPWQITLLAGPLLAMWAATVVTALPVLGRLSYWLVLVALPLLSSYPYLTPAFTQVDPPERPLAIIGEGYNVLLLDAGLTSVIDDNAPPVVELELIWQTLQPLDFDYNLFFQMLTSQSGETTVVAQLDTQPLNGERPVSSWQPGEILTDTYRLEIPPSGTALLPLSAASDEADVIFYVGYYNWQDGARIPVIDPLTGLADDKLILVRQAVHEQAVDEQ